MSDLLTILPNEIWYEIVAFYPLENVVKSVQLVATNEIELFKKYRYIKLKQWRNQLLRELLDLWRQCCTSMERRDQAAKGSAIREQINVEYHETRINVRQKTYELFQITRLPWMYQRFGAGVSYPG
jgi:hypothetical protein